MHELDELLGHDEHYYYMNLGSGIKGVGPRMPLYKPRASDLTDWSFMGALFEIPGKYNWGGDPFRTSSVSFNIELPGSFRSSNRKPSAAMVRHFITSSTWVPRAATTLSPQPSLDNVRPRLSVSS